MPRKCSTGHCSNILPEDYTFKTCERCRESARAYKARRKAAKAAENSNEGSRRSPRSSPASSGPTSVEPAETDACHPTTPCASSRSSIEPLPSIDRSISEDPEFSDITYDDAQALMVALRTAATMDDITFRGRYYISADALISYKERVDQTVKEIWQVTGYRWTVHDHERLDNGHRTRLWCSQDEAHKKAAKPSTKPDVKHRDTLGMTRYPCKSSLSVTCKAALAPTRDNLDLVVSVALKHHASDDHRPYFDVTLPLEAIEIIRRQIEWAKPNEILREVQAKFPHVSAMQVHGAWAKMSEVLWKRDLEQLPSARILLKEFRNDVDVFDVETPEGVEQLCWGMKLIAKPLREQTVEIGLDATYDTNSKHLELYSIMAEYDNAGFPLSYCLLSTATSMDVQKRKKALKAWAEHVREMYNVNPTFVHLDKDMGEIGMAREVWVAKIQLCWWHLRRAVRTRLAKNKLSTSPYNPQRAHGEFPFIDIAFTPPGQPDPTEHEGGLDAEAAAVSDGPEKRSVNALFIRLPGSYIPNSSDGTSTFPEEPPQHLHASEQCQTDSEEVFSATAPRAGAYAAASPSLTIRIPSTAERAASATSDSHDGAPSAAARVFCPEEYREHIVDMMERHLCAHPLIPGYSHPSPEGIREWAVREIYNFCVDHDLREVWAYLWENWYRPGRWELWARAPHPQIPRLKTTMLLESHWRKIKHDFLHHFRLPRLDLLAWVIVKQLARTYYRKLDMRLTDTGRYRELPDWRKAFKHEWKRCESASCIVPFKSKYRPNPFRWVCTCPYFSTSRFLLCKHLVRTVHSVEPIFFLQVTRNRTTPFWSHPTLIPLDNDEILAIGGVIDGPHASTPIEVLPRRPSVIERQCASIISQQDDIANDSDSDDDVIDVGIKGTYHERMTATIALLRDLADGLEFQLQFYDNRLLEAVERDTAGAIRLARNIQQKERDANSMHASPKTWEASNVMYYHPRPSSSHSRHATAGANN
ncbi:hypothetical protein NM688_g5915 [Phlebia brevispora]|uniref:Uncharacterized protein n=1 Tax=Phlebia brevispora TaxID=194682 RepID=A0ACC1SN78_9APHY|nr:hypothetical protein NM688_g5915 [Phlebia brevispora]